VARYCESDEAWSDMHGAEGWPDRIGEVTILAMASCSGVKG
jgi:hypothetical protein